MAEGNGNGNGNGGTARWQLWVAAAVPALALLGAIITLYVTANNASAKSSELETRMNRVEEVARDNRAALQVNAAKLTEIETQFRAADQVRNLMQAQNLRTQAMLWSKTYGQELPIGNSYYPTISQQASPGS